MFFDEEEYIGVFHVVIPLVLYWNGPLFKLRVHHPQKDKAKETKKDENDYISETRDVKRKTQEKLTPEDERWRWKFRVERKLIIYRRIKDSDIKMTK